MKKKVLDQNEFGQLNLVSGSGSAQFLEIQHSNCSAKLSLYGGHILSWQPAGHSEVLWLSKTSALDGSSPIRGGVPICWPWFGALEGEVNHGFARRTDWQLDSVSIDENGVKVILKISGASLTSAWPFSYEVTQELYFSSKLNQQMSITNTGSETMNFSDALHTYFTVSHPENVSIPALKLAKFDDKITGVNNNDAESVEDCVGPVDRIYYHDKQVAIIDKGLNRSITINKNNSKQWVLWNPGKEIADSMADVHSGGELEYVCLEAANTDIVSVKPNSSVTFGQEISVTNLN